MTIQPNGDGFDVDYTDLRVGSPVGDEWVLACPKCGRPGIRWRGTKQIAHAVRYRKEPGSGKERVTPVRTCKGAWAPPVRDEPKPTGFPWCPKDRL